jgi:predicted metalloendopeptidase
VNEHFAFNQTVLAGVKEQKPRWKRVMQFTEGALGDALGKLCKLCEVLLLCPFALFFT